MRRDARGRVWLLRLATLPFVAGAAFLIFKVVESPLTLALGHDAVGRIQEVRPYWPGANDSRFDVTFTYDVGDRVRDTGYGRIDSGGVAPPLVGQTLPIRTLVAGPFRRAELRDGAGGASGLVCVGLFATVWCGSVAVFTAVAWLAPVFDRRLVRDGNVAIGTVSEKRERKSGRNVYREILYRFQAHDDAEQSGVSRVSPEVFERSSAGDRVTVIFRPSDPSRSTLYEASNYEVVGELD
jgi:hypothetical protein